MFTTAEVAVRPLLSVATAVSSWGPAGTLLQYSRKGGVNTSPNWFVWSAKNSTLVTDPPMSLAMAVSKMLVPVTNSAWSAGLVMTTSVGPTTVIVNDCGGLVSWPPLAVPPLSMRITVTFARPARLDAGVNVRVPLPFSAGWSEKRLGLSLVNVNFKLWVASLSGPALMDVAQLVKLWGPEFWTTVMS